MKVVLTLYREFRSRAQKSEVFSAITSCIYYVTRPFKIVIHAYRPVTMVGKLRPYTMGFRGILKVREGKMDQPLLLLLLLVVA